MSLTHVPFENQSHLWAYYEDLVYLLFVDRMASIPRKDGTLALNWAIRARDPAHIVRKLIPKICPSGTQKSIEDLLRCMSWWSRGL